MSHLLKFLHNESSISYAFRNSKQPRPQPIPLQPSLPPSHRPNYLITHLAAPPSPSRPSPIDRPLLPPPSGRRLQLGARAGVRCQKAEAGGLPLTPIGAPRQKRGGGVATAPGLMRPLTDCQLSCERPRGKPRAECERTGNPEDPGGDMVIL